MAPRGQGYVRGAARIDRRLGKHLRGALKQAYLAIPLKGQLFSAMRRFYVPPERVRRYLYFRGPFDVRAGEAAFRVMHYGFQVETSIFWMGLTGGLEGQSLSLWLKLCAGARVVFDIGANTGVYALAAKAVNRKARVVAFEPVARVFEKLVANNRLNAFDIECRNEAVSNYDGEGCVFDLPIEHIYSVTLNRDMHDQSLPSVKRSVDVVKLATIIERDGLRPDLMKLDVESHEPEVIEGLGPHLNRLRPTMIVEVWHSEEHGDLRIGPRIEALLKGNGYSYYRIDEASGPVLEDHINPSGLGYSNYLICVPEVARRIGIAASP
jgi:FkbM family methyltransferase